MLYALVNGEKVQASPGLRGTCPDCKGLMIAKCGTVMPHHWAHQSLADCDSWYEGETAWHLSWKARFPMACSEVSITKDGVRHRADVQFPEGCVLEIQHSSISPEDIQAREAFYGDMCWLFDAREAYREGRLYLNKERPGYNTYRWKFPKRTITACKKPVFLQVTDDLIWSLITIHVNEQCHGAYNEYVKEPWLKKFCLARQIPYTLPPREPVPCVKVGTINLPLSFLKRSA